MITPIQAPIVIQARCSSSRLPSKVLMPFVDQMLMLEFQYKRLSEFFPYVVIATSTDTTDDPISELCEKNSMNCYRGSLQNVMLRLIEATSLFDSSADCSSFIRVGGDDPLISPEGIVMTYEQHIQKLGNFESLAMTYSSYDDGLTYGCACECFTSDLYRRQIDSISALSEQSTKSFLLEHTKPSFSKSTAFNLPNLGTSKASIPLSMTNKNVSLSIDYPEDFLFVSYVASRVVAEYGFKYSHFNLLDLLFTIPFPLKINSSLHNGFGE